MFSILLCCLLACEKDADPCEFDLCDSATSSTSSPSGTATGTTGTSTQTTTGTNTGTPAFSVSEVPSDLDDFGDIFSKYVNVFGVHVLARDGVADNKVLHCANILAQYLDNDEDGTPDDALVIEKMTSRSGSAMIMFASESEAESFFDTDIDTDMMIQDLYAPETLPGGSVPGGRFDATLEEVLHLVTFSGWHRAYPDALGLRTDTELSLAMDIARGGRFMSVPSSYPDDAWYHYDDRTCNYNCMLVEYIYWGLTSLLGAQDYAGRCDEIDREWELCSSEAFTKGDPALYALVTSADYPMPTVLPDGTYQN
jgi:hypothetical protein